MSPQLQAAQSGQAAGVAHNENTCVTPQEHRIDELSNGPGLGRTLLKVLGLDMGCHSGVWLPCW